MDQLSNGMNAVTKHLKSLERPGRIRHAWVLPSTVGLESTVTLTFEKRGDGTPLTLVHSGLPDDEKAKSHQNGWNSFLDLFHGNFGIGPA